MTAMKGAIAAAGYTHARFAAKVGLSRPALSAYLNHDVLPASVDRSVLVARIASTLRASGIALIAENEKAPECSNTPAPDTTPSTLDDEEALSMLLRKTTLSQAARRHFDLARDPFAMPQTADDVYLSGDIRYVRESLWSVVRHGGFLAVVGESGAGKSTLRDELLDRVQREDQPAIVIEPYVIGMEETEQRGQPLRATDIAAAIMACVSPHEPIKNSRDARWRQLHNALRESSRAGHTHVLVIEEAHALPVPTLRHLKRFIELKDAMRPLLAVVLFGQPELESKLNENDPRVREIVQRVEIVHLPPLNADLEGYLKHRFERAGAAMGRVFEPEAVDALRSRLTPHEQRGTRGQGSLLYPLVVQNVLAAAMNNSASLGLPRVTADTVRGV